MDNGEYKRWKAYRIDRYITDPSQLIVPIRNPDQLTCSEKRALLETINRNNFAVYQYEPEYGTRTAPMREGRSGVAPNSIASPIASQDKRYIRICQQLGLVHSIANPESGPDNVTLIQDMNQSENGLPIENSSSNNTTPKRYIPYTNKPLGWHTDGYYNPTIQIVRSFILHCDQAASAGGDNELVDPEMIYLQLRNANPQWAEALTHPDVMTIPSNVVDNQILRKEFQGPVFVTDKDTGYFYTRYTERKRHIQWKQDLVTTKALEAMRQLLEDESRFKIKIRLKPGQGLICNNVIHRRTSFSDMPSDLNAHHYSTLKRCLHRIRFTDRLSTDPMNPII